MSKKKVSKEKVVNELTTIDRIVALMESGQQFIPVVLPHTYGKIKRRLNKFKGMQDIEFTKFRIRGNTYQYNPTQYALHLVKKEPYADVVYVITTLHVNTITLNKAWKNRVVGWYPTLWQANEDVIMNACDINEGLYDYCVIEKLSPGIYPNVEQEWWFEWNSVNNKYKSIPKKPDLFNHCTNFGIG